MFCSVFDEDAHRPAADHAVRFGDFAGQVDIHQLVLPGADDAHGVLDDGRLAAAAANTAGDLAERADGHLGACAAGCGTLCLNHCDDCFRIVVFRKVFQSGELKIRVAAAAAGCAMFGLAPVSDGLAEDGDRDLRRRDRTDVQADGRAQSYGFQLLRHHDYGT